MASSDEKRRAERQRVSRTGRPRDPNAVSDDRRRGRSTYEDRVYDNAEGVDEGEDRVVWVPLARFRPFGRNLDG